MITQPNWLALKVKYNPEYHDIISSMLWEFNPSGVQIIDDTLIAFYPQMESIQQAIERLNQATLDFKDILKVSVESLESEDWVKQARDMFQIQRVTDRVVVQPTWMKQDEDTDKIVLYIEPGRAFGTGEHQTTRLMLRAMDKFFRDRSLPASLLDWGCGSGILAMLAAKVGVKNIVAIDNCPDAIFWANKTLIENGIRDNIELLLGDLHGLKSKFQMMVANIQTRILADECKAWDKLIPKHGYVILSGILIDDLPIDWIDSKYKLLDELIEDEWVCLVYQKS